MAVSIRREKPEDMKENGSPYNYRIIFRTSEVSEQDVRLNPGGKWSRRGEELGIKVTKIRLECPWNKEGPRLGS